MSKLEIQKGIDKKIIKELKKITADSFMDISIKEVLFIPKDNSYLFILKTNSFESWLDISDSVVLKELSDSLSNKFNDFDVIVTNKDIFKNAKSLYDYFEEKENEYKEELLSSKDKNALNSKIVKDNFLTINKRIRDNCLPLINATEMFLGFGAFSNVLKNIGHLSSDITDEETLLNPHLTKDKIKNKVSEIIPIITAENVESTMENEIRSKFKKGKDGNPFFIWDDFDEYKQELCVFLEDCASSYSELPVYNSMQYHIKYAMVAISQFDFDKASESLVSFRDCILQEKYEKNLLSYTEAFEYQSLQLVNHKIHSRYGKEIESLDVFENENGVSISDFKVDKFASKNTEPEIIKEYVRYCLVKNKTLTIEKDVNVNKLAYTQGGFKDVDGALIISPKLSKNKSQCKEKRRP